MASPPGSTSHCSSRLLPSDFVIGVNEPDRRQKRSLSKSVVGERVGDVVNVVNRNLGQSNRGAHFRNFWLLAITFIIFMAINSIHNTVTSQVRGRRFAIQVNCAVVGAVSEAGRSVIVGGSSAPDTPFDRALEKLGFPPRKVRVAQATQAAQLYVDNIVAQVAKHIGEKRAKALIRRDGALNCDALQQFAAARTGTSNSFP